MRQGPDLGWATARVLKKKAAIGVIRFSYQEPGVLKSLLDVVLAIAPFPEACTAASFIVAIVLRARQADQAEMS
ncbi:hypothetical protein CV770_37110 [Bradyrhizobium sp. AC87j1]|uniref:hypothetical protein n=1 Tax=Bradyrhizobium sp. AC87j1 TaxID=2055894 RepID=UPI000CECC6D6|nr:hypothetical protein [Bradyrhizobium sp. AC87j1]PPQ14401.1 hypothetical protein CV770_37110 [Bradyrhizobium sp. AC87j1]